MRPTPNQQTSDQTTSPSIPITSGSIPFVQNPENKSPWLKEENAVSENASSSNLEDLS